MCPRIRASVCLSLSIYIYIIYWALWDIVFLMAEDPWRLVLAQGTSAQGISNLFSQASFAFLVLALLGVFLFGSGAVRDPVGAYVCYSSGVLFGLVYFLWRCVCGSTIPWRSTVFFVVPRSRT